MKKTSPVSLRQLAAQLGISPAYLSYMVNGKRPWRPDLYERYSHLVNTSVNSVNYEGGQSGGAAPTFPKEMAGAGDGIRTHDFLLGKQTDGIRKLSYAYRCTSRLGNHTPLH